MSTPHYQIIRRPIITEKGLGVKETQHTVVFEVSAEGHQDADQGSRAADFQGESSRRAHREFSRQDAPPRPERRLSARLEKGLREAAEGEKMIEYAENL